MIYVYRRAASSGAVALARELGGMRVKTLPRLTNDDVVVCWGMQLSQDDVLAKCRILNGTVIRRKQTDAKLLRKAGVPTITISEDAPQGEGWLARTAYHTGGLDLLKPTRRPDYWVKREELVKEFRVHSFLARSIRAGVKVVRNGVEDPHPWIRSWDGGWRISYDGTSVKQKHRDIAHQACKALKLDFGAVDIGEHADGSVIVLEVNRAPGLEGKTIPAYAKAIQGWIEK